MWILDTNVISEMVAPRPDEGVLTRVASAPKYEIFTTAITEAELFHGVERMSPGRRREGLRIAIEAIFDGLRGHILPFESSAAHAYARLMAECAALGRPMSQSDAQIAAITITNQGTLVTRNTRDFANSDIALLNPWLA